MRYYLSKHEFINLKQGKEFAGLFKTEKSDKARYKVDVAILANCYACDDEFVLEEKNEHHNGDFCDHCMRIHGD